MQRRILKQAWIIQPTHSLVAPAAKCDTHSISICDLLYRQSVLAADSQL